MSEEICKNCKYHYTEEISFDYPQSCCNKTNPNHTTEEWLHCDCFEYSKNYITNLQKKVEQLEKEVNEYQKELEKADSITQSCIFQGKQESKISFRNCLNRLEQLENIRKEAIEYVLKNKLYRFKYDDEELFEITTDKKAKDDLLNILNKGSDK